MTHAHYNPYNLGRQAVAITCPNCRNSGLTKVTYVATPCTHVLGLAMLPLLLCWVPYVTGCSRRVKHTCSLCGAFIGYGDSKKK